MPTTAASPQLNILHVLTLNGRNGEYGGPVRVARELCQELNSRGHQTHIFSGALKGSEPTPSAELSESFIHVRPITQKLKVSSLWSWKLIPSLRKLISNSDLVHIHFARDLVPFLAAFLAIILRKPFITQTHGMIIQDGRISTRITDFLFTKPLVNRSRLILVLTDNEEIKIKKLKIKPPTNKLPNGIKPRNIDDAVLDRSNRIAFISRIEKRKRVVSFIKLAAQSQNTKFMFEIYGPDGGELSSAVAEIGRLNVGKIIEYKGSVAPGKIENILKQVDLLVLPSRDEPFPMIVLEALAVGTPVLVMPSCGIASALSSFDPRYVCKDENDNELKIAFQKLASSKQPQNERVAIKKFCDESFGIGKVVDQLQKNYYEILMT